MSRRRDQTPPQHRDHDVRKVIKGALKAGWFAEHPGSHQWGWLVCGGAEAPAGGLECRIVVKSTPKGSSQAKILRERLAKCPHGNAVRP